MGSSHELDAVRLEIALYFQRNPFARETARSLGLRLGRPDSVLCGLLERLVQQTILERRGEGERALYRYKHPYIQSGAESTRG